ncbi:putative bifunctional diguanylate cyclase/phosphodiesterase [Kineosporia succinea]
MTTKSPATRAAMGAGVLLVLVIGLVPSLLGRPAELAGMSTLPWWVFAVAFAVTEACGLNVGVRGRRWAISLSGIPLAAGLYLADPAGLLAARLVGSLLVSAWYRRHSPMTLLTGAFAVTAGTGTAELLFRFLVLRHDLLSYSGRTMTLLVVVLAALVEITLLLRVHFDASGRRGEALRLLVRALAAGVMGAAIGLLPVLSISRGEAVLPGIVLGPGLVVGFHAFAMLSDRHHRLRRLYDLSEALAHVPAPARAIPLVLEQSADLLRARYAELVLEENTLSADRRLWSFRAGQVVGPRTPADDLLTLPFPPETGRLVRGRGRAEREFLRARGVCQAVLVPLRIDDRVVGHLLVGERAGGERGFAAADLTTLETVAARAAVALGNGHLLERLQFEARHDELTGLPNRLDFRAQLDECVGDLMSTGRPCAVMLLDFNGFKAINDSLGHQAGDQLLRELAGRFREVAGRGVTIARLGGDEFAALAPGMGDGAARALARRLLSAFDEPVLVDGNELRAAGSLGVAVGPEQGTTGAELLRRADVAMYVAKSAGGGYRMFNRTMDLPASQVHTLATALEVALRTDSIQIAVQPMVDLVTGRVHALEALARWKHPELGEVPPEDFFAAAERSGMVGELSRRVLDQALSAARDWLENGRQVRVAINLAPGWLADPTLPEQITTALAVHDLPAEQLYLEFSEGDVIDEPDHAVTALARLRALGVRLSVDDFGTGYSSLTFLSRLPVDQIKIHQSFVQELRSGGRTRAVVQSIIDLGRNLGLEVVAEGVTDAHTRIELKRMGCGFGQGYYFDAPMAVGELSWLAGRRLNGFGHIGQVAFPPAPRVLGRLDAPLDTLAECSPPTSSPAPSPVPPSVP